MVEADSRLFMLGTIGVTPLSPLGGLRWCGESFAGLGRGGLERWWWSCPGILGFPGDGFPGVALTGEGFPGEGFAGLAMGEAGGFALCLDDGDGILESLTCRA